MLQHTSFQVEGHPKSSKTLKKHEKQNFYIAIQKQLGYPKSN